MKRVMYLVMVALVSTMVVAPPVAAQAENLQQLQQALQQAQDGVQTAQQYMQSEAGQKALQDAQNNLQVARDNARDYLQNAEGVQQLQQNLQQAQANVQQAVGQLQKAREGLWEEATSKMERTALVKSGGPGMGCLGALAAPAAALLVGGAVLGYAVLRRR